MYLDNRTISIRWWRGEGWWLLKCLNQSSKVSGRVLWAVDFQLLSHGRWFSPGTPASSPTKTGHDDIAEILLKVALNIIKSNQIYSAGNSTFFYFSW
jgi:hypothetical protein